MKRQGNIHRNMKRTKTSRNINKTISKEQMQTVEARVNAHSPNKRTHKTAKARIIHQKQNRKPKARHKRAETRAEQREES